MASIASAAGAATHLVAATLGHASPAVTLAHYAKPEAVQSGQAQRALTVLLAGKSLAKNPASTSDHQPSHSATTENQCEWGDSNSQGG